MNLRLLLFQICSLASLLTAGLASAQTKTQQLVVGTISDEPVKEIRVFLPFAQHLARQLAAFGVEEGTVVIARDIDHMVRLVRNGEIDLFVDSPLVAMAINTKAGSRLLARRWKKGIPQYHSVVFVLETSDINNVQDLEGQVIAFEESFSSSGHLLPRMTMAELGVDLKHLPTSGSKRPSKQTGYVFTGDDENTIEWVLRGRVDAGAMSMASLAKHRTASDMGRLKIILRTADIPRHAVSVSPEISQPFVAAIEAELFAMHDSTEGRAVLDSFEGTTRFDAISQETMTLLTHFQAPLMALVGED